MNDQNGVLRCHDVGLAQDAIDASQLGGHFTDATPNEHPEGYFFNWNTGRVLDGLYFVYISRGEGLFESERSAVERIGPHTCFVLFPGVWHQYRPDVRCGWEEYWVGVKGLLVEQLSSGPFFNPAQPVFHVGEHESLLALFGQLFATLRTSRINPNAP
ncbi:AraC family ligand binding domain-containing protein [Spirosoma montaniterrae]|uniref:AraC family ligand binding domain-containing protein n=1 Tax=Spirosoma montaniterrae TaxID=1178516 RepID=UPI003AB0743E